MLQWFNHLFQQKKEMHRRHKETKFDLRLQINKKGLHFSESLSLEG
jgi:hypothetical protein